MVLTPTNLFPQILAKNWLIPGEKQKEVVLHSLFYFHGLITRELMFIKKGDASPFKDFKSSNLKYAKCCKIKGSL
jgi:hypothetical protein